MYRSSVKRRVFSFLLSLLIALSVFAIMPNVVLAAAETVVSFNFEQQEKRDNLTNHGLPYSADGGSEANKDYASIRLIGAASPSTGPFSSGAGSSGNAHTSNDWATSGDKYWMIEFSTIGYESIRISSKQRSSSTGPRDFILQWGTDGQTWENVTNGDITVSDNFTNGVLNGLSLPVHCNNQGKVYLRWLKANNVSVGGVTVAANGTNRIDDIMVQGEKLDVVSFSFEDVEKRGKITNDATWRSEYYTADGGIQKNKNIAKISLNGSSFNGWVKGHNGIANSVGSPNSKDWHKRDDEAYWQIEFSTAGYTNLNCSSRHYGSATGPAKFDVKCSSGNQGDSIDIGSQKLLKENEWYQWSGSLPVAMDKQDVVCLRWIRSSDSGTIKNETENIPSGGTNRIDDIVVTGDPIIYTIEFDDNGATSGVVPYAQKKNHGFDIELSENLGNLSRDHHIFKGWNTRADGKGTHFNVNEKYKTDENITLYAEWEPIQYHVTYVPGAFGRGTESPFKDLVVLDPYPSSLTLPSEVPGQEGYLFSGWKPSQPDSPIVKNDTFTALWTLPQDSIVFHHIYGGGGNPGTGGNFPGVYEYDFVVLQNRGTEKIDLNGWKIEYAAAGGSDWTIHPLEGVVCPGNYFVIRASSGGTAGQYKDFPYYHLTRPNLKIEKQQFKMVLKNPDGIPVDFVGSGEANQYLGADAAPKTGVNSAYENQQSIIRKDHTGDNWNDYEIQEDGTTTSLDYLNDQLYTIRFDKNGGNTEAFPDEVGVPHGYFNPQNLPQAPKKSGHSFARWNTQPDGSGSDLNADMEITTCMTFYAQYTPIPIVYYTVTFVDFNGRILKTQSVEKGQPASPPADLEREGYHFTGWAPSYQNVQSDLTVIAQYEAISELPDIPSVTSHTVSFIDHDGKVLKKETVGHGTSATPPADPVSEGLVFLRWVGDYQNVTEDRVIKALYEATVYTIVYKDYDGTILYEEQLRHGQAKNPPVPQKRPGFDFIGWNKDLELVLGDDEVIALYAPRSGENNSYNMLGMLFILLAAGSIGLKKRCMK